MPDSAQVTFQAGTLPEGACYQTEQQRLDAFAENLIGSLPGNYGTVNVGSDEPSENDRDKWWLRSNPDGSPDGAYFFYNGAWCKKHPLAPGLISIWLGAESDVPLIDGGVAGTATATSGPFWEVVTAMSARFPVGVGTFPLAGAVAVNGTGGEDKHTLLTTELPSTLGKFATGIEKALGKKESGVGAASFGSIASQWDPLNFTDFIKGGDDTPHNNLPPYIGVYFIRRTARLYMNPT